MVVYLWGGLMESAEGSQKSRRRRLFNLRDHIGGWVQVLLIRLITSVWPGNLWQRI